MDKARNLAASLLELNRAQRRKLVEGDVRDFISKNPIPYRLEYLANGIWQVFALLDQGEKSVGKIYRDDDVPRNAAPFWHANRWTALPDAVNVDAAFFAEQEQAIDWLIHLPR